MKNLFLVPTPDETRVAIKSDGFLFLTNHTYPNSPKFANHHIYITNDEKPKEGDWCLPFMNGKLDITEEYPIYKMKNGDFYCEDKKIILTDDTELINDGVQAINDEFLEWFVNNQSCEEVKVKEDECGWFVNGGKDIEYRKYNYIEIPKEEPNYNMKQEILAEMERLEEEPKEETLEEVCNKINFINPRERVAYYNGLKNGAKWQQKRSYSEEEAKELLKMYRNSIVEVNPVDIIYLDKWFEKFKKK